MLSIRAPGFAPRQNQAYLTNNTVKNLLRLLGQLVGVDGQRRNVLVLNQRLGILGLIGTR
jgi:hypothetical protein